MSQKHKKPQTFQSSDCSEKYLRFEMKIKTINITINIKASRKNMYTQDFQM